MFEKKQISRYYIKRWDIENTKKAKEACRERARSKILLMCTAQSSIQRDNNISLVMAQLKSGSVN